MAAQAHIIRNVRDVDHGRVCAVLVAAFGQEDEAMLVHHLWDAGAVTTEKLAVVDDEIVGYCAFSPITLTPKLIGPMYGLGPVAVRPDHQRTGLGAAMIKDGLKDCREAGARLIAVLGDPKYYARFGFEPAAAKNIRWAVKDAGDAFRIIIDDENHWGDIRTDEPRLVHYHPAFDAVS
jgi:putative acetyltransferase